ncbi:hypothetical protein CEXT_225231 [Caerostris extrusa]|uniref:Uncharacterized protein n=1 Tax=Caerostris extrusa TaxID=172846 RepID=A0AAV4XLF5_CAEEX|nr:hypothetical protein CEXT_225231 [Caerostris extrusa]
MQHKNVLSFNTGKKFKWWDHLTLIVKAVLYIRDVITQSRTVRRDFSDFRIIMKEDIDFQGWNLRRNEEEAAYERAIKTLRTKEKKNDDHHCIWKRLMYLSGFLHVLLNLFWFLIGRDCYYICL